MIFVKFILWFLLSELLICSIRYLFKDNEMSKGIKTVFAIGELLLSIVCAFIPMAGPIEFRPVQPFLMAMYVALFMDGLCSLSFIYYRRYQAVDKTWYGKTLITLVAGSLLLTYGMINMNIVSAKEYEFTSSKITQEYKIAFVADMHIGSAQTTSVTIKYINKIKDLNPTATILGGDIIDEYTTLKDMKTVLAAFKDFESPVYFVYGNHDGRGIVDFGTFQSCLYENNIILLEDDFVSINSELLLFGRKDLSNDSRLEINQVVRPEGTNSKLLITADHQPTHFQEQAEFGTDLQLSGHTHAGQLWPLNNIYPFFTPNFGSYATGDSIMIVSSGASGWRVPLRTANSSHYDIITLKPLQ